MITKIAEYLQEHDVKPSMQRVAIMSYLATHRTHPTVDEIYMALSPDMPTLSRTTVYNTLNLLVEQGAAQLLDIDEHNARYDACMDPHAHFRCKGCGAIFDMEAPRAARPKPSDNFVITEMQIYYKGYCSKCSPKSN